MAITATLFVNFPEMIVALYSDDRDVRTLAVQLLYIAAFFQLSDGMQVGALGALRGLKDTRFPFITNLVIYWGIGLPIAYLVGVYFNLGHVGIWVVLIVGLSIAVVLHSWRFQILTRRLLKHPDLKETIDNKVLQMLHD